MSLTHTIVTSVEITISISSTQSERILIDMAAPKGRPIDHDHLKDALSAYRSHLLALSLVGLVAFAILLGNSIFDWSIQRPDTLYGDDNTVIIAVQAPLSGPQAEQGNALVRGVLLALDAAQTIRLDAERELTITTLVFDDQSDPTTAVGNARAISRDPNVLAVVGHVDTRVALAAAEVYERTRLPAIYPAITYAPIADMYPDTTHLMLAEDAIHGSAGAALVEKLIGEPPDGQLDILIVDDGTAYSQRVVQSFKDALRAANSQHARFGGSETEESAQEEDIQGIVYVENFDEVLELVDSETIDLIYISLPYEDAAEFATLLSENEIEVRLLGPDILHTPQLVELGGPAVDGLVFTALSGPATWYDEAGLMDPPAWQREVQEFIAEYENQFGSEPDQYALEAYYATELLLSSIRQISRVTDDKPTRAEIQQALDPADAENRPPLLTTLWRNLVASSAKAEALDTVHVTGEGVPGEVSFTEQGLRREMLILALEVISPEPEEEPEGGEDNAADQAAEDASEAEPDEESTANISETETEEPLSEEVPWNRVLTRILIER
jgi:branched-chain amino acid transport system substrate-binding protein